MEYRRLAFLFSFLIFSFYAVAQNATVEGRSVDPDTYEELHDKFEHFELYQFQTTQINQILQDELESNRFNLKLGNLNWQFDIHPHDIRSENFMISTEIDGKTQRLPGIPSITYRGGLVNDLGADVTIAIMDQMIIGRIKNNQSEYLIESLNGIISGAPSDIYVVYETSRVIPATGLKCGVEEAAEMQHRHTPEDGHNHDHGQEENKAEAAAMACHELIVSLACDAGYTARHGGSGAAIGRMIGILNLVQTNYDNEFRDEIQFALGPTFTAISTNPPSWNFSTNSSILSTFRSWGNGGGFGSSAYDVATLWTVNTFGGVIGTAYLSALCGGNRYNFCVDFTSIADGLRDLQAHELGHNFGFTHDPSGTSFIMTSGVFSSNIWSGQSQGQFNSRVPYACMGPCFGGVPPIADFEGVPEEGCTPMTVNFTDLSMFNPTQWRWSFPGGTPSSSTQQNPVVHYTTPGAYPVTLEVSNTVGSNTETRTEYILVGDVPITLFDANINQDKVVFVDESVVYGTANYMWDFGDGNFSSETDPTHVYDKDGEYRVILTVTTACGSTQFSRIVEIVTPPEGEFSAFPTEGCVGTLVAFKDESSENVLTYSWKFEKGNPGSSNVKDPLVQYDTAGTFKVTLVLSNSRYNTKVEKVRYITIDSAVNSDFGAEVNNLEVMFMDSSDHAREYAWDFGDGGKSNQQNPTKTYLKDSTYEVTLITTNLCNEDTITKLVDVGSLPTADFESDKQIACLPGSITFEDQSSANATRRIWKFEGGNPASSTEASPTVAYDQTGSYKVTLIAINGLGTDTLIEEKYITIEDQPEADFDFIRNGYDIEFMSNSTGGTQWNWDFGDGNSSIEENPMHMYDSDGDYKVVLITSNNCGTDTISKTVSISNRPNANFTSDENVGCFPMTVNLENQSSGNSSDYEWLTPGGNPSSSTDENPTITYDNPGLYKVTLIAKNTFGNDTVVKRDFIEVLDVPRSDFTLTKNGFTIEFEQKSDYGKEFEWDFGDGATSELENPTHVYTGEGVFKVILVVKNICGSDTLEQDISVTPRPILAFDLDNEEICKDGTISYMDMTENDPTDWKWTFEGGTPTTSTDQNPTITYNTSGTYDVILEATNSFGTSVDTFQQLVRVFDEPLADYSYEEQGVRVNFMNFSEEFGDILWDFGDGDTSTEFEPSHLYSLPGTYRVELSVTNECGVDVYEQEISVRHKDLDLFMLSPPPAPNPSNGVVTVSHIGKPANQITISIAGINGRIVELYKGDFTSGSLTKSLDLSDFDSGTYTIFYQTDYDLRMSKIVLHK